MLQKSKYQDFLDQFTEEVVLVLAAGIRGRELELKEQERLRKVIEAEKFKIKISPYIQKNQNQAPQQIPSSVQPQMQKSITSQQVVVQPQTQNQQIKHEINHQVTQIRKIFPPTKLPPLQPGEIDFGKIIFLIRDPLVSYIEVQGENKNITIKKAGQTLKMQLTLTREEIISIIMSFSEKVRIPLVEGLLNARYENIEISAIVSESISPSFIIRKNIVPYTRPPNQFLMR
jgi:hypothetical protein